MTDIDLIDWTIQEAQHLKNERRGPSDLDAGPSLDKLLAVLERELVGPTNPEDPVAQIAGAPSIQMTTEEKRQLQARPLYPGGGCYPPLATRGYSYAPRAEQASLKVHA